MLKSNSGLGLLTAIITAGILATAAFMVAYSLRQFRVSTTRSNQKLIAQSYTIELVEYFRSLTNTQLRNYLAASAPYALCASVNLLNRETGVVSNPEALANLPAAPLSSGLSGMTALNRFYRIEVINRLTLAANAAACGQSPAVYARGADESFLVTVGTSWIDPQLGSDARESLLSVMLTDG
jgi:hypothetical protein